jgi:hypothetical protein
MWKGRSNPNMTSVNTTHGPQNETPSFGGTNSVQLQPLSKTLRGRALAQQLFFGFLKMDRGTKKTYVNAVKNKISMRKLGNISYYTI